MPDYSKGKIYKLVNDSLGLTYIGSTTQSLSVRKAGHTCASRWYSKGKGNFMTSFKLFDSGVVDIVLIETCCCSSKEELHSRERYWIENMECVNKCVPCRTLTEYREAHKDVIKAQKKKYRESHKDVLKAQEKKYRESHKDAIKAYNKEYHRKQKTLIPP